MPKHWFPVELLNVLGIVLSGQPGCHCLKIVCEIGEFKVWRSIDKRFPFSEGWERQNPMLVYNGYKWEIQFPFQKKVKLKSKNIVRPVLSVDLGINCTATVSVIYSDGTVGHREFIYYA